MSLAVPSNPLPLLRHFTVRLSSLSSLSISLLMLALTNLTGCQTAPKTAPQPIQTPQPTNAQKVSNQPIDSQTNTRVTRHSSQPNNSQQNTQTVHTDNTSNDSNVSNSNTTNDNAENTIIIIENTTTESDESPVVAAPPYEDTDHTDGIDDTDNTSIIDDSAIIMPPIEPPSRQALLERARQNSQSQNRVTTHNDGNNLPAFRRLMQAGIKQLSNNQLTEAQTSFTRAQRLAPKSSAVYFYLAQVALKKNQPRKAEAMARRGLVVSQDINRRHALWQIILQAGQKQNNPRVIEEATNALRQLTM